jgi:hypothetical protein
MPRLPLEMRYLLREICSHLQISGYVTLLEKSGPKCRFINLGNDAFSSCSDLEMGKVIPGPGPKFFFDRDQDETGTKIFLTRTSAKLFLNRTGTKMFFFWTGTVTKIFFDWDQHQNLFLKRPGPKPKTFSLRDRD